VSTAQDLPGLYGEPLAAPPVAPPALRLVPAQPLDFDDAVRRVRPRLHRYAIRRLGDAHEAEELVQEALLRAYTHREQLLTEEDLSAWATVVTGRLVIDRLRVRGRSTSMADVPEGSRVGRDTADVVVARDEARTALDALDAMPARQASLLWAREVEGKSYEELCQQFAMTEPAVRSVLTRARKALRREYELRGGTVPVAGLAVLAPWIAGLSWADKLRRATNRLTAPAVLGAAGIAALGGLVLSPYGADHGRATTTFTPAQAIVASPVHASAAKPATAPAAHVAAGSVGTAGGHAATAPPAGSAPLTRTVHGLTHPLGCHESSSGSPLDSFAGTPRGIGLGNADCPESTESTRLGVHTVGPLAGTDYGAVSVNASGVRCTSLNPLTQRTQLLTCSEAQK
jgi:RNA polymerase sigma-70 factor (ECF subfamily)